MSLRIILVLGCLLGLSGFSAEEESEKEKQSHVVAVWGKDTTGRTSLFLWSKDPLKSVMVWDSSGKRWLSSDKSYQSEAGHAYRMPASRRPKSGEWIFVRGELSDRSQFIDKVLGVDTEAKDETSVKLPVLFWEFEEGAAVIKREKEEAKKRHEALVRLAGKERARFIDLLNAYRRRNGLRAVVYDHALSQAASVNNSMGGGHRYAPCAQNWAWCSWHMTAPQALVQWQNSSGHNALLLNSSITRVGIAFDGGHATMNAR